MRGGSRKKVSNKEEQVENKTPPLSRLPKGFSKRNPVPSETRYLRNPPTAAGRENQQSKTAFIFRSLNINRKYGAKFKKGLDKSAETWYIIVSG